MRLNLAAILTSHSKLTNVAVIAIGNYYNVTKYTFIDAHTRESGGMPIRKITNTALQVSFLEINSFVATLICNESVTSW